ncbi:MAG: nucleoside hydrolase-like domain-containing protein [Thermomicrobiales bacterium]
MRLIIETDAGGDPDDEQSLVRFLLYANEWDVGGIIANRAAARDRENLNPERTGLGVVLRLVNERTYPCLPCVIWNRQSSFTQLSGFNALTVKWLRTHLAFV